MWFLFSNECLFLQPSKCSRALKKYFMNNIFAILAWHLTICAKLKVSEEADIEARFVDEVLKITKIWNMNWTTKNGLKNLHVIIEEVKMILGNYSVNVKFLQCICIWRRIWRISIKTEYLLIKIGDFHRRCY